jgi:Macrocin-O-methyltransferase (TylF)
MRLALPIPNVIRKLYRILATPAIRRQVALVNLHSVPFRLGLRRPWPGTYLSYVPDRYMVNRDRYLLQGGARKPWEVRDFLHRNSWKNGGDLSRWYFLNLVCDQITHEGVIGDIAEVGVYKGNTAALLANLAREIGSTAYLLDTYAGFSDDDLRGIDAEQKMAFADTSLEAVRSLIGEKSTRYIVGRFPESAQQMPNGLSFALVHLDCDLYSPMKAGLEYFYPLLMPGGFLIMHDYSSLYWPGARQAIDEFFVDKPERLIPIADKSGSAAIRKLGR